MDSREFVPFSLAHWAAMAATAAAAIYMVRLNRSPLVSPQRKHRANVILGVTLVTAVTLDPVLTWVRYGDDPSLASRLTRENSLPLYLCDVVSLVLAWALIKRRQRFAEIGYLWGMAGTVQGLITPTLYWGWENPEYYAFFAQHGGVPVAALTLAFGTEELKPLPGALSRAIFWSWIYMAAVYGLNWLLEANYGFLNAKPAVATLFDYMGPYPWYLLTLQAIAFSLYALLLLPFRNAQPAVARAPELSQG
jgi:hypothetical integral membrane protein (TIGR02206 family)